MAILRIRPGFKNTCLFVQLHIPRGFGHAAVSLPSTGRRDVITVSAGGLGNTRIVVENPLQLKGDEIVLLNRSG